MKNRKNDVVIKGVLKRVRTKPEVFRGHVNIMTPHVIGYYQLADAWIELSEGDGMERQGIYGVTVMTNDNYVDMKRSKMFYHLAEAYRHIEDLSHHEEPNS